MKKMMKKMMKKIIIVALLAVFTLSFGGLALSQEKFPNRPVNVIVPWAPGGGGCSTSRPCSRPSKKRSAWGL